MEQKQQKARKKGASGGVKKAPGATRGSKTRKNPRRERAIRPKVARIRWLALSDVPGCRKALARIAKEFKAGLISEAQARTMAYVLRATLAALEVERDMAVEQKLADLLGRLEALEGKGKL